MLRNFLLRVYICKMYVLSSVFDMSISTEHDFYQKTSSKVDKQTQVEFERDDGASLDMKLLKPEGEQVCATTV